MIHRASIGGKLLLASLCLLMVVLPLAAQNLTLEETRQMRDDAVLAKKASSNPQATAALDRVIGKLDTVISKLEEKAADIYDKGKKYPTAAKVEIKAFDVPVGATEVHVPVTMDRQSPNTVIAHVRVFDGKGGRANPDTTKPVIFRPGDPLTKTATFKIRALKEGADVRCNQPSVPDGAYRKGGSIRITAKEGAVNEPIEGGREPLPFEPLGKLTYNETGDTIKFDDKGGSMSFSTALSHGRTQVGNGETGYYGEVKYDGFKRTKEGLVLSSRRLEEPVKFGTPAIEYPFLAVMLSGHRTPETYFKHGSVEWVVKMPNRRGSWPALWLVPTGGWPPEIDVYEGFGYNGSWRFNASLSTNLHGGDRNQRTFTRPAMYMKMSDFGLPNTLDSEFHTFAVTVTSEWITMFVDGVETMQYANPFDGEQWYPLTNVAVKAKVDSPYDKGTGDMVVKSIKVWRAD
ncbi:MAG: family 16 glycosylhydrolase [Phycisphaeraceae bacterium JB051]